MDNVHGGWRRFCPSFSLRFLLLLVLIAAVLFGACNSERPNLYVTPLLFALGLVLIYLGWRRRQPRRFVVGAVVMVAGSALSEAMLFHAESKGTKFVGIDLAVFDASSGKRVAVNWDNVWLQGSRSGRRTSPGPPNWRFELPFEGRFGMFRSIHRVYLPPNLVLTYEPDGFEEIRVPLHRFAGPYVEFDAIDRSPVIHPALELVPTDKKENLDDQ